MIEDNVRAVMAIDTNHDGRITFAELVQKAASIPYPLGGSSFFNFSPLRRTERVFSRWISRRRLKHYFVRWTRTETVSFPSTS
jgi:hypothetical protein